MNNVVEMETLCKQMLIDCTDRTLIPAVEVQNFLLDLMLLLPKEKEVELDGLSA